MENNPKVSIIIPVYGGENHLGDAIQSVLNQTYENIELIVVNDASPGNTSEVMNRFNDPRLRYIVHEKNKGVDLTRSTGISSSTGEIIAFLDQDDFFHPEKIQSHVSFLTDHPEAGFTYNARFELNFSSETIRNLWRPPVKISLADLVLWFPLAPSDWVLRREWAWRLIDFIKVGNSWTGGEIVYLGNLYMDGCRFEYIDRALNYRRHHSGRVFRDLSGGCAAELAAQEKILNDPRCPADVKALRETAHANILMFWAYRAFAQGETELGREFVRRGVRYKPSILIGSPSEFLLLLSSNCSEDENIDHAVLLEKVFSQLPSEFPQLMSQKDWAVYHGYLLRGMRAIIWGRLDDGKRYLKLAAKLDFNMNAFYLDEVSQHILNYDMEFGEGAAQLILNSFVSNLGALGFRSHVKRLKSVFSFNLAFEKYKTGKYSEVPASVMASIVNNPRYLLNRGIVSIFARSVIRSVLN